MSIRPIKGLSPLNPATQLTQDITGNVYWFEDFLLGYVEPVPASVSTRADCFGLNYQATPSTWIITNFDAAMTDPSTTGAGDRWLGAVQLFVSSGNATAGGISLRLSPALRIANLGGRFGGRMAAAFGLAANAASGNRFTAGIFNDVFTVPNTDSRLTSCLLGFDIVGSTTLRPLQNGAAVGSDIAITQNSIIDWYIEKPAGQAENGVYRLRIFIDGVSAYDSGQYTIPSFPTTNVEFSLRAGKSATALASAVGFQLDYLYAYTTSTVSRFVPT